MGFSDELLPVSGLDYLTIIQNEYHVYPLDAAQSVGDEDDRSVS